MEGFAPPPKKKNKIVFVTLGKKLQCIKHFKLIQAKKYPNKFRAIAPLKVHFLRFFIAAFFIKSTLPGPWFP